MYISLPTKRSLRDTCSPNPECRNQLCNLKNNNESLLSPQNCLFDWLSVLSNEYCIIYTRELSNREGTRRVLNGQRSAYLLVCFYEKLWSCRKKESKLRKDVKTMDNILCYLMSKSTVISGAFLVKTFTDRLEAWKHGTQADWDCCRTSSSPLIPGQGKHAAMLGETFESIIGKVYKHLKM